VEQVEYLLEVTAMQQIFYTPVPPEEYARLGKDFPFPQPTSCPNPGCLVKAPPQKHGFYQRNVIAANFCGRILIRRYYCKYCRTTISYLPSFCLPYFQYTVEIIFTTLWHALVSHHSFSECLNLLKKLFENLYWEASHLQFYVRRFLANLNNIKVGLRQLLPRVSLPQDSPDKKEGARKVLHIVAAGFPQIQTFSSRFYAQCGYSFMAPLHNILA
jgi:hypothetical protein